MSIAETKKLFANDRFAAGMGAEILSIGENEAVCELVLNDSHRNAKGNIQGGAIFTLSDFAFGVAANPDEEIYCVLHNASMTYIKMTKGSVLTARAKVISRTRHTRTCEVTVTDDLGITVATGIFNGQVIVNNT